MIGGFIPKVNAAIHSIPVAVMGGISLLLYGLIAASGLRLLVKSGIDFGHSRNLILASVVLVVGIGMDTGGFTIPLGHYSIPGMELATILGTVPETLSRGFSRLRRDGLISTEGRHTVRILDLAGLLAIEP